MRQPSERLRCGPSGRRDGRDDDETGGIPRIPAYALPSYVQTPEERERFELSHLVAELISADNEPDGRPNSEFVFHMRQTVYFSDIPTGTPEDWPG